MAEPMERQGRHFQEELEHLKTRLLEMGGLAEEQVQLAVKALVDRDRDLIERVLQNDEPINKLHIEIDGRCFTLLALHQPMAVDLRAIVSAVKINTDLERVGDLAINIAEAARRYAQHPAVKKLIDIPRMATIAQSMLREALDAFVRRDVVRAQHVLDEDDKLDSLKTQIFRELLTYMLQDPGTIEAARVLKHVGQEPPADLQLQRVAQHVLDKDDKLDSLKTQIFRELLTYMLQDPGTIEAARVLQHVGQELPEDLRLQRVELVVFVEDDKLDSLKTQIFRELLTYMLQ